MDEQVLGMLDAAHVLNANPKAGLLMQQHDSGGRVAAWGGWHRLSGQVLPLKLAPRPVSCVRALLANLSPAAPQS